jgi:hypothetical protein
VVGSVLRGAARALLPLPGPRPGRRAAFPGPPRSPAGVRAGPGVDAAWGQALRAGIRVGFGPGQPSGRPGYYLWRWRGGTFGQTSCASRHLVVPQERKSGTLYTKPGEGLAPPLAQRGSSPWPRCSPILPAARPSLCPHTGRLCSPPMSRFPDATRGCFRTIVLPRPFSVALIHRSAWKGHSQKFVLCEEGL